MKWITRQKAVIDRVACPWLIARRIDREPEFVFVPMPDVFAEAEQRDAIPYDIPGAELSHVGEQCSFDAFLARYGLAEDPALQRVATIVRGADTDRLDLAPQSAGLLAVSLGMGRTAADDHALLGAMFPVYDALYEWARSAAGERHGWPPAT